VLLPTVQQAHARAPVYLNTRPVRYSFAMILQQKRSLLLLPWGVLSILSSFITGASSAAGQSPLKEPPVDESRYKAACPDYVNYAKHPQ